MRNKILGLLSVFILTASTGYCGLFGTTPYAKPANVQLGTYMLKCSASTGCLIDSDNDNTAEVTINSSGQISADGGFVSGASSQPSIIFDSVVSGDTDYWMADCDDGGGDNNDEFQIGTGTTKCSSPLLYLKQSGEFGIGIDPTQGEYLSISKSTPIFNMIDTGNPSANVEFRYVDTGAGTGTLEISPEVDNGDVSKIRLFRFTNTSGGALFDLTSGANSTTATIRLNPTSGDSYFNATTVQVGIGRTSVRSILDIDRGTGWGQVTMDGSSGGCLMIRDTDDAGWTECSVLNGTMTCTTDADGDCDGS